MAPNLILQAGSRANLNEMHKVAATTDIIRMLIKYHKIIWMVSFSILIKMYSDDSRQKSRVQVDLSKLKIVHFFKFPIEKVWNRFEWGTFESF